MRLLRVVYTGSWFRHVLSTSIPIVIRSKKREMIPILIDLLIQ